MLKLTWPRAAAWRLRRQHLDPRAPAGSLLAVASRLCGLHAQVMSSAELTAWARVPKYTAVLQRGVRNRTGAQNGIPGFVISWPDLGG